MDKIPRYNEDYFNCVLGHYISYLKHKQVPVELLFYNCYEHTSRIFKHFVELKLNRWKYHSRAWKTFDEEISRLHIKLHNLYLPTFAEAKPIIASLLDRGIMVFIYADGYFIPHRRFTYQNKYEGHSFMLSSYAHRSDGTYWYVQDHAQPDFYNYYHESIMESAYDDLIESFGQTIQYFEFEKDHTDSSHEPYFMERFRTYLLGFYDDFSFYDKAMEWLTVHEKNKNTMIELTESLGHAFSFIESSRNLLKKFIRTTGFTEETAVLDHISVLTGELKNIMGGYRIANTLNLHIVIEKCRLVKEMEKTFLNILKHS